MLSKRFFKLSIHHSQRLLEFYFQPVRIFIIISNDYHYLNFEIINLNFVIGGDADEDDINYCFDPISIYFEELEIKDAQVL